MSKKPVTKKPTVVLSISENTKPEVPQTATPDTMLAMAVEKGMDLAYVEKLMELRERWLARQAEQQYFEAFASFQKLVPDLKKTVKAKFTYEKKAGGTGEMSYKHDDIGVLKAAIREPMSQFGLSQTWDEWEEGDKIFVACVIQHVGGYKQVGKPLSASADTSGHKNGIQAKGSTLTYLRRYTLTGMLGLSSSEDDDGHGASQKNQGSDLPTLNDNQFATLTKKVIAEKWTMEQVEAKCFLTPSQKESMETIIKSIPV